MRGAAAMLGAPPDSSFEVFGVDMLVDTDYRPWLVEINAVPSLARKVCHYLSGKPVQKKDGLSLGCQLPWQQFTNYMHT